MRAVLADLALESEAATVLAMHVAGAYDREDEGSVELRRLLTPAAKYWICKRLPAAVAECMEVLGGNGYVEDAPLARLFRESPLNSIWEGSGNVMCLDVLRAAGRTARTLPALWSTLEAARGRDPTFDAAVARLQSEFRSMDAIEARARRVTQQIAVLMQASLLLRHAPEEVASAFCATRLAGDGWGAAFGASLAGLPVAALVERALPVA